MGKVLAIALVLCGFGCITHAPVITTTALQLCREQGICECAAMCAQVLPEMALSKDSNHVCRCWAMGSPENTSPVATAKIVY